MFHYPSSGGNADLDAGYDDTRATQTGSAGRAISSSRAAVVRARLADIACTDCELDVPAVVPVRSDCFGRFARMPVIITAISAIGIGVVAWPLIGGRACMKYGFVGGSRRLR